MKTGNGENTFEDCNCQNKRRKNFLFYLGWAVFTNPPSILADHISGVGDVVRFEGRRDQEIQLDTVFCFEGEPQKFKIYEDSEIVILIFFCTLNFFRVESRLKHKISKENPVLDAK